MPRFSRFCLAAVLAAAVLPGLVADAGAVERRDAVSRLFDGIANDPPRLRMFLTAMPKGGDLHNHLAGAVYAESYLAWAAESGLCLDGTTHAIVRPPCTGGLRPVSEAMAHDPALGDAMIDALSMRDFTPHPGDASGHDHFFATFGKFDAAATGHIGEALAEEAHRAAAEHVGYLEIMWYPRVRESAGLGLAHPFSDTDFAADLAAIRPGIPALLSKARADTDQAEARMRTVLRCGQPDADPGCGVTIRYQTFLLRTLPPAAVFAQMAYSYAVVGSDPRFVGVNIVAPEDNPVALRDYRLHMRAFGFFHAAHPEVKLSLHAGELTLGLVPPDALRSHIRDAVEIAGASRIGHGVDIGYETDAAGLLREMARRHVTVEINQTSNDQILGVRGAEHPFALYRAYGVPVVLSTDDEGVERIDLTHEYLRAVRTWHLDYAALKSLARASVADSFLSGEALASGADGAPRPPGPGLLAHSDKARQQWALERDLARFEAGIVGSMSPEPRTAR
jgi:adenosine deaminase